MSKKLALPLIIFLLVVIPFSVYIAGLQTRTKSKASSDDLFDAIGKLVLEKNQSFTVYKLTSPDGSFFELKSPEINLDQYINQYILVRGYLSKGALGFQNSLVFNLAPSLISGEKDYTPMPNDITISPVSGSINSKVNLSTNYSFGPREIIYPCGKGTCTASLDIYFHTEDSIKITEILSWSDKQITISVPPVQEGPYYIDFFFLGERVTNLNKIFYVMNNSTPTPPPTTPPSFQTPIPQPTLSPAPYPILPYRYSVPWYFHKILNNRSNIIILQNLNIIPEYAVIAIFNKDGIKTHSTPLITIPPYGRVSSLKFFPPEKPLDGSALIETSSQDITVNTSLLEVDGQGNAVTVLDIGNATPLKSLTY